MLWSCRFYASGPHEISVCDQTNVHDNRLVDPRTKSVKIVLIEVQDRGNAKCPDYYSLLFHPLLHSAE